MIMGFFDELTDFVNEVKTIKTEFNDIAGGVVDDVKTSADNVKKTVGDTADEIKSSASEIRSTLQKTEQLDPVAEVSEEHSDTNN